MTIWLRARIFNKRMQVLAINLDLVMARMLLMGEQSFYEACPGPRPRRYLPDLLRTAHMAHGSERSYLVSGMSREPRNATSCDACPDGKRLVAHTGHVLIGVFGACANTEDPARLTKIEYGSVGRSWSGVHKVP